MPEKRSKWNYDPSQLIALCVVDTVLVACYDPFFLLDWSGSGGWHAGVEGGGPGGCRCDCNSAVRAHSWSIQRTPHGIRNADKPVAVELLRHSPACPPQEGTRQRQWLRGNLEPALISDLTKVAHRGTLSLPTAGSLLIPSFVTKDIPNSVMVVTR